MSVDDLEEAARDGQFIAVSQTLDNHEDSLTVCQGDNLRPPESQHRPEQTDLLQFLDL